jgi:hypothetical protein
MGHKPKIPIGFMKRTDLQRKIDRLGLSQVAISDLIYARKGIKISHSTISTELSGKQNVHFELIESIVNEFYKPSNAEYKEASKQ